MKLEYKDGLLFTEIDIVYKGIIKHIDNVVVDTGAAMSIIDCNFVCDIIHAEINDRIKTYYGVGGSTHISFVKVLEELKIGDAGIKNVKLDFGEIVPDGDIYALLGLDVLTKLGAIIDLKDYQMTINAHH